jgi:hypothetical protein
MDFSLINRSDRNPVIQREERKGRVYIRQVPYFCLNVRVPHMAIIYDKELLMAKYIS